ncbi:Gfo/Idh/MocA family oxidoreductase [Herbiconiux sp. P18]|uniref:Gfo/Idh/MocA family oxidoreductase n=1 Tax=Herbiconiux liangxiaofengii TaxID=3342795 RepID=UPI0035B9B22F
MADAGARPPVLGMIGAGFHARTNILPSLGLAGLPLAALGTRSVERSQSALALAGSPEGTPYASAESLLAHPGLDGVLIVAQPHDQLQLTLQSLAAGIPVFVDKPLGLTGAEARQVARAADDAGVGVQLGFMKRHAPVYQRLRALLDEGALGSVRSFAVQFGCDSTPFCRTEAEFVTLAAIHLVDLVRYLFGEVETVHAVNSGEGANVALSVTLGFASGVSGTLDLTGLPSRANEVEGVRVIGDAGFAETTDAHTLRLHTVAVAPGADLPPAEVPGPAWGTLAERDVVLRPAESAMSGTGRDLHLRGFVGEVRAFADAVAAGTISPDGAWDNVATMDLCDRILASSSAQAADRSTRLDRAAAAGLVPVVFGDPGPFRDQMVQRILSGRKTGSTTLEAAFALSGVPVPRVGERRALLDSAGDPAALLEYTEVVQTTLADVTPELALQESPSIDAWRAAHVAYFQTLTDAVRAHLSDPAWSATDPGPLVATTFRVIPLD